MDNLLLPAAAFRFLRESQSVHGVYTPKKKRIEGPCACGWVSVYHGVPWILFFAPVQICEPMPGPELARVTLGSEDSRNTSSGQFHLWNSLILSWGDYVLSSRQYKVVGSWSRLLGVYYRSDIFAWKFRRKWWSGFSTTFTSSTVDASFKYRCSTTQLS